MTPRTSSPRQDPAVSRAIDVIIEAPGDWRSTTLARLRAVILSADACIVEEVKWKKPSRPVRAVVGRTHRSSPEPHPPPPPQRPGVNRLGNSGLLLGDDLSDSRGAARPVPRWTADVAAVRSGRALTCRLEPTGHVLHAGQLRAEGARCAPAQRPRPSVRYDLPPGPLPIRITSSSPCGRHRARSKSLTSFESARPEDPRPRRAIEQAGARVRGEITMSRGRAPRPSARVRMPRCRLSRPGPAWRSRAVPARHRSRQPPGRTSRRQ